MRYVNLFEREVEEGVERRQPLTPISTEIVWSLAGTIGLVLTIPITAVIEVWMKEKKERASRSFN